MSLITIILLSIIGAFVYAIIGNVLVRWFDKIGLISVDIDYNEPDTAYFVLGVFLPFILFYIAVKELSNFIHLLFLNHFEKKEDLGEFDEFTHNLKRKTNGKKEQRNR